MRTTGPGANGTTSRRAVSYSRIRSDPAEPEPGLRLVPHVDREQDRGERLHPDRVLERPAVECAQVGDAGDDLHERRPGGVVVTARDDVALHLLLEVDQLG